MTFTILFHGSGDTHFEDDKTFLAAYSLEGIQEGSHTMSFFSDCFATNAEQVEEPLFTNLSLHQQAPDLIRLSNELAVIKGPEYSGSNVYHLIELGVLTAVNALLRGERNLNFFGFSRGAVIAIEMSHELQRIQEYINNPENDLSPESLVTVMITLIPNAQPSSPFKTPKKSSIYAENLLTSLNKPELYQNLVKGLRSGECKLNGKLLDPVPGFCENTTVPSWFPWTDRTRHTVIPPIVNHLEIAYMEYELSVGFRAVLIKPSPNSLSQIITYSLPGMHTTAIGNPVDHHPARTLRFNPRFPYQQMRNVQHLFFYKLLQFSATQGIRFKPYEAISERYLSPVFEHFVRNRHDQNAQHAYIVQQNHEILNNLAAYQLTRRTFYAPSFLLGSFDHIHHERILMSTSDAHPINSVVEKFANSIIVDRHDGSIDASSNLMFTVVATLYLILSITIAAIAIHSLVVGSGGLLIPSVALWLSAWLSLFAVNIFCGIAGKVTALEESNEADPMQSLAAIA